MRNIQERRVNFMKEVQHQKRQQYFQTKRAQLFKALVQENEDLYCLIQEQLIKDFGSEDQYHYFMLQQYQKDRLEFEENMQQNMKNMQLWEQAQKEKEVKRQEMLISLLDEISLQDQDQQKGNEKSTCFKQEIVQNNDGSGKEGKQKKQEQVNIENKRTENIAKIQTRTKAKKITKNVELTQKQIKIVCQQDNVETDLEQGSKRESPHQKLIQFQI